ncbi:hypothetical protein FACS18945_4730 [Bacteroidia bacterium]|nr:hypothetical protein FACS18945_4730 [Bacteroidia bacterium]
MNGIDIQFLDGIENFENFGNLGIRFLDSTAGIHGVFDKMKKKAAGKAISVPFKKISELTPEEQAKLKNRLSKINTAFRKGLTPKLGQIYDFYTQGYTPQVADNVDTVLKGLDFAGFAGDGSVEDDEMLLNHLVRTKYISENAPQTVAGYQNPKMFNKMLGYVIDYWDTPDREKALDIAASEEQRLIGIGAIVVPDHQDEQYEFLTGDIEANLYDASEYEVNGLGAVRTKTPKRGFFNTVRKLNSNAALTEDARALKNTTQNAFLRKKIGTKRKGIFARRKKTTKTTVTAVPDITPENQIPAQPEVKTITQETATTPDVVAGLGSTYDNEQEFNHVLQGYDLVGTLGAISSTEDDFAGTKAYLQNTRDLIAGAPDDYFDSNEEARMTIGSLDYMVQNFDNPITREKALGLLAGDNITDEQHEQFIAGLGGFAGVYGLGALDGKLKNALKKVASKVKEKVKTVAKVVKATIIPTKKNIKAAASAVKTQVKQTIKNVKYDVKKAAKQVKEVAKKVGKFIKKVVKFLIKIGPISLLAKAGVLICMRTNMFKMASKLFPAIATPEEIASNGITQDQIDKAKKALDKTANIYADKLGGSRSKLEAAIRKGAKKVWKGGETFNKAEMEAAAATIPANEQAEAQAEMEADKQAMIAQGAQFDNNYTSANISVQNYPNGITVEVPAPADTAVQGVVIGYLGNISTENEGLGFPPAIAAAATVVAAILGVIGTIIGKAMDKKTVEAQAKAAQAAAANPETEYVDENGNPIEVDENGNPIMPEEYESEELSTNDQMIMSALATNPDMIDNPTVQAAIASNPKLASNPVVTTALATKTAATAASESKGLSTGAIIGIAAGGVAVLGLLAYFALRNNDKKEEAKQ